MRLGLQRRVVRAAVLIFIVTFLVVFAVNIARIQKKIYGNVYSGKIIKYSVDVEFASLDYGILTLNITNKGTEPIDISKLFIETPEGYRYPINNSTIIRPGDTITIKIPFNEPCYEYSLPLLLASDVYNISVPFVVYCR